MIARNVYLTLTALQGFLFMGPGLLMVALALHLLPSDPDSDGQRQAFGPWNGSLKYFALGLGVTALGLPGALGVYLVLCEPRRYQRQLMIVAGLGTVLVTVTAAALLATGHHLGNV